MPISPLNRVLLLLSSFLLVVLVGLWVIPVDQDWDNVAAIAPIASSPVAIEQGLPLSPIDNLTNRPIFDPSRRAADTTATQTPVVAAPPTLTLAGLLVGGNKRVALIRSPDSKDLVLAHEGDTVSSWLIKEIDVDHVVITNNGTTQELRFPLPSSGALPFPGQAPGNGSGTHSY